MADLKLITQYTDFVPNQFLTAGDLNSMLQFLYNHIRFTRTGLLGRGIVCGLDMEVNANLGTITIHQGIGVTSDGYAIDFVVEGAKKITYNSPQKLDVVIPKLNDPNDPDSKFSNLLDFYELTVDENGGSINFEEICGNGKQAALFLWVNISNPGDGQNVENQNTKCSGSTDTSGNVISWDFVPLIVVGPAGDLIASSDDGAEITFPDPILLKRYAFVEPELSALCSIKGVNQYLDYFIQVCNTNAEIIQQAFDGMAGLPFVEDLDAIKFQKWKKGFEYFFPSASFGFNTLFAPYLQYCYDYLNDVAKAFNEYLEEACVFEAISFKCQDAFVDHCQYVSLGAICINDETTPELKKEFARHEPPSVSGMIGVNKQSEEKKVKKLYDRLRKLTELEKVNGKCKVKNFKILSPFHTNSSNNPIVPDPLSDFIKITSSRGRNQILGKRPIPYYFDQNQIQEFIACWTIREKCLEKVFSYHHQSKESLLVNIEDKSFFRVEGHIGHRLDNVCVVIDEHRKNYNLPFDLVVLKLEDVVEEVDDKLGSCHFYDLEAKYSALVKQVICNLGNWAVFLYDQDVGVNFIYNPSSPEDLTLITACNSKYIVKNGTLGAVHELNFPLNTGFWKSYYNEKTNQNEVTIRDLFLAIEDFYKGLRITEDTVERYRKLSEIILAWETNITNPLQIILDDIESLRDEIETDHIGLQPESSFKDLALEVIFQFECLLNTCLDEEFAVLFNEYTERVELEKSRLIFNKFCEKHPGMEHMGGVPKGGTFILVYSNYRDLRENSNDLLNSFLNSYRDSYGDSIGNVNPLDNIVLGDFALPYSCVSDCPPQSTVILCDKPTIELEKNTFCDNDDTNYPIIFKPQGGDILNDETDGVIEDPNSGLLVFNPSLVEGNKQIVLQYKKDGCIDEFKLFVETPPEVLVQEAPVDDKFICNYENGELNLIVNKSFLNLNDDILEPENIEWNIIISDDVDFENGNQPDQSDISTTTSVSDGVSRFDVSFKITNGFNYYKVEAGIKSMCGMAMSSLEGIFINQEDIELNDPSEFPACIDDQDQKITIDVFPKGGDFELLLGGTISDQDFLSSVIDDTQPINCDSLEYEFNIGKLISGVYELKYSVGGVSLMPGWEGFTLFNKSLTVLSLIVPPPPEVPIPDPNAGEQAFEFEFRLSQISPSVSPLINIKAFLGDSQSGQEIEGISLDVLMEGMNTIDGKVKIVYTTDSVDYFGEACTLQISFENITDCFIEVEFNFPEIVPQFTTDKSQYCEDEPVSAVVSPPGGSFFYFGQEFAIGNTSFDFNDIPGVGFDSEGKVPVTLIYKLNNLISAPVTITFYKKPTDLSVELKKMSFNIDENSCLINGQIGEFEITSIATNFIWEKFLNGEESDSGQTDKKNINILFTVAELQGEVSVNFKAINFLINCNIESEFDNIVPYCGFGLSFEEPSVIDEMSGYFHYTGGQQQIHVSQDGGVFELFEEGEVNPLLYNSIISVYNNTSKTCVYYFSGKDDDGNDLPEGSRYRLVYSIKPELTGCVETKSDKLPIIIDKVPFSGGGTGGNSGDLTGGGGNGGGSPLPETISQRNQTYRSELEAYNPDNEDSLVSNTVYTNSKASLEATEEVNAAYENASRKLTTALNRNQNEEREDQYRDVARLIISDILDKWLLQDQQALADGAEDIINAHILPLLDLAERERAGFFEAWQNDFSEEVKSAGAIEAYRALFTSTTE